MAEWQQIKDYLDSTIKPIHEDVKEMRADIKELKEFKWKVTAIAIAASGATGLGGFSIAKLLDKFFAG